MQDDKVNILVLEDEGIVAMALEDTLESQGYGVAGLADNGREALDIMKRNSVDLALLDIHVKGDWDGVETARKLTGLKDIPFIFLTAFSDEETISRARDTMPHAYLVKPYQPQNLLIAIDLALHNFQLLKSSPNTILSVKPDQAPPLNEPKDDLLVFNHSIFIRQNYKYVKIIAADIMYLEVSGNHTWIKTSHKKYIVRYGLQTLLEKFNAEIFVRVHRSFAINFHYVSSFDASSVFVNDVEIPLGRMYKDEFLNRLRLL